MKFNFAIDLDGTIAEWGHDGNHIGDWIPGSRDALFGLRALGHSIVVHSCRTTWNLGGGVGAIAKFLRDGGFTPWLVTSEPGRQGVWSRYYKEDSGPRIGIWAGMGKPIAHFYIDDRAIEFTGDWNSILNRVL